MENEIKVRHPIIVSFNAGATVNVGNYQSVKVNVGLSIPIYNHNNIDATYHKIAKKVEKMLEAKIEEYTKAYAPKQADELILEDL